MQNPLYIKEVEGKGRAVFSSVPLQAGEVVEACRFLVFKSEDHDLSLDSFLINFSFYINQEERIVGIATGFGSLYNHATPANAIHKIFREENRVDIMAIRDIPAHEEICINYHGPFDSTSTDWFEKRGLSFKP